MFKEMVDGVVIELGNMLVDFFINLTSSFSKSFFTAVFSDFLLKPCIDFTSFMVQTWSDNPIICLCILYTLSSVLKEGMKSSKKLILNFKLYKELYKMPVEELKAMSLLTKQHLIAAQETQVLEHAYKTLGTKSELPDPEANKDDPLDLLSSAILRWRDKKLAARAKSNL